MNAFIARGYVEGGTIINPRQQRLNVEQLPPILRTLLITDGTVTKVLEAYYWEPVNVEAVDQHLETASSDIENLGIQPGERILRRQVILHGSVSGDSYALAESIIRTSVLPAEITTELIEGRIGIGQLLRTKGLETFREIIDLFEETATESHEKYIARTYRIYLHDVPAMTVTERFPVALYERKP